MKKERFYIDKRGGCIAVLDRTLTDDSPGLHRDTAGVVNYWSGVNGPGGWEVPAPFVEAARITCETLNSLENGTPLRETRSRRMTKDGNHLMLDVRDIPGTKENLDELVHELAGAFRTLETLPAGSRLTIVMQPGLMDDAELWAGTPFTQQPGEEGPPAGICHSAIEEYGDRTVFTIIK